MNQAFMWTVAAFLSVTVFKLTIALNAGQGLFASDRGGLAQPERVQLIVLTLAASAAYGYQCISTILSGDPKLVDPEPWILAVAGGSNLFYLLEKMRRNT